MGEADDVDAGLLSYAESNSTAVDRLVAVRAAGMMMLVVVNESTRRLRTLV